MPNRAKSLKQFRLLKGIQTGSIPSKDGLTPKVAGEMLGHQSPKGLPLRALREGMKGQHCHENGRCHDHPNDNKDYG